MSGRFPIPPSADELRRRKKVLARIKAEEPIRRAQAAEQELKRRKGMNREADRLKVRRPYPKAGT